MVRSGRSTPADARPSRQGRRSESWRETIRVERRRLGLTQADVAERAGVSTETVRKYENGDRTPSRASLDRILAALVVPQTTVRAVRRELGFDSPESLFDREGYPGYSFTVGEMRSYGDQTPWPQFGVNNVLEMVTANRAAQALWGIDFDLELTRRSRAQANFLAILAERGVRERLVNWRETITLAIATLKAIPQAQSLLDASTALFGDVFASFAANDPAAIATLFALWEHTPPATAKARWSYPVVWHEPGFDEMRFHAIVTTASEPDALAFNDWIPADAAAHVTLEHILGARLARPPSSIDSQWDRGHDSRGRTHHGRSSRAGADFGN